MKKQKTGFTLVETLIGAALFLVIAVSVYQGYLSVLQAVRLSTSKIVAANLANEQFEIIRNLPYSDVGIIGGLPSGKIPYQQTIVRDSYTFLVTSTIRNVDLSFDGTIGGSPNDLSPADNKLVEITVDCTTCNIFTPLTFTTRIAPKNLETASTNGALFVRVFDANGVDVPDASVHIESVSGTPAININDVTNSQGMLQIVDIPPGVERYKITVSKEGYSTVTTYSSSEVNNPVSPHATVVLQQVTQSSFAIDHTATLYLSTVRDNCAAVVDVPFTLTGSKLIGADPNVIKFSQNYQTDNSNGTETITGLEWDTYTLVVTDASHDLIGSNPLFPFDANPGAIHNVQIILAPENPDSLMVTIKDSATGLPLSGASVTLDDGASYTETLVTGRGFLTQTDWSGGAGQAFFVDTNKYLDSDSNIETNNPAGIMTLKQIFGSYASDGWLVSSTFDTGSESNFYNIMWQPQDQPPATGAESVRIQIATTNDQATTTWNYLGPDGTAGTYYTVSNSNIASAHNGDRYLRYKIFLHTDNSSFTPTVADISFTFTSECTPPGQIIFSGISADTYTLTVSKPGYDTTVVEGVLVSSAWQQREVRLIPSP
ncbi:MAG: hypothetical protein U1D31_03265 [Patescibacteria group bacterium]|nr:hypothetical protein [Patescibacteria group bacterium]